MITGTVNANREAIISCTVRGPAGQEREIEAVIDTAFNGFLTLPPSVIAALGLSKLGLGRVLLADGSQECLEIYEAVVMWDGKPRVVEVDGARTDALVGMAMLDGHELRIAVVVDGTVRIDAMGSRAEGHEGP